MYGFNTDEFSIHKWHWSFTFSRASLYNEWEEIGKMKAGTKEKLYLQLPDCGWTHSLFLISWGRSWCFKTTVMCLALPSSVSCIAFFMVVFFLYCSLSWVSPWKRHRTTFSLLPSDSSFSKQCWDPVFIFFPLYCYIQCACFLPMSFLSASLILGLF